MNELPYLDPRRREVRGKWVLTIDEVNTINRALNRSSSSAAPTPRLVVEQWPAHATGQTTTAATVPPTGAASTHTTTHLERQS